MSQDDLFGFLSLIKTSPLIQDKLRQASDAEAAAIAQIAAEAGFSISLADLKRRGRWWEQLS